jgi:uncharacterized protein YqgV (UPF0045/DUF77 family)
VKITAELSLYPLKNNYEEYIFTFIESLRSYPSVDVVTHSVSTFVKGQRKDVFDAIEMAMASVSDVDTFSLVMKIINRDLPIENGFLIFE